MGVVYGHAHSEGHLHRQYMSELSNEGSTMASLIRRSLEDGEPAVRMYGEWRGMLGGRMPARLCPACSIAPSSLKSHFLPPSESPDEEPRKWWLSVLDREHSELKVFFPARLPLAPGMPFPRFCHCHPLHCRLRGGGAAFCGRPNPESGLGYVTVGRRGAKGRGPRGVLCDLGASRFFDFRLGPIVSICGLRSTG